MQLELFVMEEDYRCAKMRQFLESKISNTNFWFPSAIELVAIGDEYGVIGSLPLKMIVKVVNNHCEELEESLTCWGRPDGDCDSDSCDSCVDIKDCGYFSEDEFFDFDDAQKICQLICFYKRKLGESDAKNTIHICR